MPTTAFSSNNDTMEIAKEIHNSFNFIKKNGFPLLIILTIFLVFLSFYNIKKVPKIKNTAENRRLFSSVVFLTLWVFLAAYYFCLHFTFSEITNLFTYNVVKKISTLIVNVMLTLLSVWATLSLTLIPVNDTYFAIFCVLVIFFIMYLAHNFSTNTLWGFIIQATMGFVLCLAIGRWSAEIRVFLKKLRKAAKDLYSDVKHFLILFLTASLVFTLQVICITGIIQKADYGVLTFFLLVFIFDWSYNFITGIVHSCVVYKVFTDNSIKLRAKVDFNHWNDNKKKQTNSITSLIMETCYRSTRPSILQLTYSIIEKTKPTQPILNSPVLSSFLECIIGYTTLFFEFFKSDYNDNLATYAMRKSKDHNHWLMDILENDDNFTIFFLSQVRTWVLRIPFVLATFFMLRLDSTSYCVEYNILTALHQPFIFLKSALEHPNVSSTSFIICLGVIILFLLSIESSYITNEQFYFDENDSASIARRNNFFSIPSLQESTIQLTVEQKEEQEKLLQEIYEKLEANVKKNERQT